MVNGKPFEDGDVVIFRSYGINYMWYLEAKVVWPHGKATLEIQRHWRRHKESEDHPESVGTFEILENTKRTACAVQCFFDDRAPCQVYAVENPAYVFSYKQ